MSKSGWVISERSGMKFRRDEMIQEPLTNLWVHKSESDGYYEIDELNARKRLKFDDPKPVRVDLPDIDWVVDMYLQDSLDNFITDSMGNRIEI